MERNNPTIDGVSLLPVIPTAEMCRVGSEARWKSPVRDADNVREIYCAMVAAAPVVERQKICSKHSGDSCKTCGGSGMVNDGELTCSSGGVPYENGPIQCVKDCPDCQGSPEVAALQSTIAQLQARITQLESEAEYAAATHQAARDRIRLHAIASLSGSGEPVATVSVWHIDQWYASDPSKAGRNVGVKFCGDTSVLTDGQQLFTAPPAPVAVVLPERKPQRITDAHAEGWNACLDAAAALNEVQSHATPTTDESTDQT